MITFIGIVNPENFVANVPHYMIGQGCAMLGAASWQILASVRFHQTSLSYYNLEVYSLSAIKFKN